MNNKKSGTLYLPKYQLCNYTKRACLRPLSIVKCPKEKRLKKLLPNMGMFSPSRETHEKSFAEYNRIINNCQYKGKTKMTESIYNLFEVINELFKANALDEICLNCKKRFKE